MAEVLFDWVKYDAKITGECLDRMEAAAKLIRDNARSILRGKLKGDWPAHGPYTAGKYAGKLWTARQQGAMVNTIRYVRKDDKKDVWILSGTKNTWWATQLEYGRGGWKGGRKSFMRPALANRDAIKAAIESGPRADFRNTY